MHFQFIGPAQSVIQKAIGYVRSIVVRSERGGVDFFSAQDLTSVLKTLIPTIGQLILIIFL
jgi:hypothetical protein